MRFAANRPRRLSWVAAAAAAFAGVGAFCQVAHAAGIELVVDRADGSVFFVNSGVALESFDGYTLTSPGGAFDAGAWTSIAGNFDLSGDQSVDSTASWFVIGTPGDFSLTEASSVALSAQLFPTQIISLGPIFDTAEPESLTAMFSADTDVTALVADFRTLTADYDGDLDVDLDDYDLFVSTFGSTIDLRADGNGDGVVDAADYNVWRDSEELSLTPSESLPAFADALAAAPVGVAIPEPGTLGLAVLATLALTAARRPGCCAAPAAAS